MDFPSHLQSAFEDNFGYTDDIGEVSIEVDHGGQRTVSYHEFTHDEYPEEGNSVPDDGVDATTPGQYCNLGEYVTDLAPEHVRWFYKTEADKKWNEFDGYDSLRIEAKYREYYAGYYRDWAQYGYDAQTYCEYPTGEEFDAAYYEQVEQKGGKGDEHSTSQGCEEFKEAVEEQSHLEMINPAASKDQVVGDSNLAGGDLGQSHLLEGQSAEVRGDYFPNTALGDKIVVRGGLYEVDLQLWKCLSTYWPGEVFDITRGSWYSVATWQPLSMEDAEKLEVEHMKCFGGHNMAEYLNTGTPIKTPRPVLHTVSFSLFHVDWLNPAEVYLYHETTPSKLVRSVTQRLGFQKPAGHQLCRGYKTPCRAEDKPTDISHLVFVVHGIGQKMDTGRIVRNCSTFRDCVTWLKQKYFPYADTKERAEFFPVEWRSSLKLDGDIVELITPQKVLGLRQMLNATAMDIMYYTSPLYRGEIQRVLQDELTRLYTMFCQRNPTFEPGGGKVSIVAHSLGCVIMYDIITGWTPPREAVQITSGSVETEPQANGIEDEAPHLLFRIENFFCIGSPLSVFLALRWKNPHNPRLRDRIIPKALCKHIFNIFHPSDPVAYRIEPLLIKHYSKIAPVQIHAYNAAVKTPYKDMPKELIVSGPVAKETEPKKERENGSGVASPKSPGTPSKDKSWSLWNLMRGNWRAEALPPESEEGVSSDPPQEPSPSQSDLEYRIDYVLREGNLISSSYLSALTSHTAYWGSLDVAHFVLNHLYSQEAVRTTPDSESPTSS